MAIERQSFPSPWTSTMFLEEMGRIGGCYVVAVSDGEVIGYTGVIQMGEDGHITNLAVQPEWRRKGVAKRMLLTMFDCARQNGLDKLTLEVRQSNASAQELYLKFGFLPRGRRRGYYTDSNEDAIIYWSGSLDSEEMRGHEARMRQSVEAGQSVENRQSVEHEPSAERGPSAETGRSGDEEAL